MLNQIEESDRNKNNFDNITKINLGIEILRAYMSFSIVVLHFLKNEYKTNFFIKFIFYCFPFYVPTFFLISFYFIHNTISSKNIIKIKERFIKIIIPYIIWPIFLWIWNIIINYKNIKFNWDLIRTIILQLLVGHNFYKVYWFLFDLIIITIIFTIIRFSFKNYLIILRISFPLVFSINEYYHQKLSKYNYLIGAITPLPSSFIYSVTGFLLGYRFIIKKLRNKRYIIFVLIIPEIFLINKFWILFEISKRVEPIIIDIIIILLFICFALIPFETIKNKIIKKIIKQLSSYTGGIYYIHVAVYIIFSKFFKILSFGNFKSCIINYLFCYFICLIGSFKFKNNKLKYLFL